MMIKRILNIITFLLIIQSVSYAQAPSVYKISRMPFNDRMYSDISPVIIKDGILFCSNRRFSSLTDRTGFNGSRIYNIYSVSLKDSDRWTNAREILSDKAGKFNNGPLSIAPDGKTVYFTSETETGTSATKKSFKNHSGIFIAELSGNEIISIHAFKHNNIQYDLGHPAISKDGKYLFFSSNMPGGQGKSDIWYCELVNGEWSEPVNPGPKVNTPGVENYPYMHSSGKLYFTSDRPGGFGKLDVYATSLYNGKWEEPTILPEPINSSSDDFALVASDDMQTGYLSSNRVASDDIFKFTSTIIRKASCNELIENGYCYEFFEVNAIKYDTIPFQFHWRFSDGVTQDGKKVVHCFPGPGKYIVQLDVTNLVTKEKTLNQKTDTLVLTDEVQPYITSSDTVSAGKKLRLDSGKTNLPGWDITQYYWNFGDETIATGKEVEKTWTRPGAYNIQLIVNAKPEAGEAKRETCVSKNIIVVP
jgi:hypothetical protein